VAEYLKRLKNNKSAGPDAMKHEFYKALVQSDKCVDTLTWCFNRIMETGEILNEWKI